MKVAVYRHNCNMHLAKLLHMFKQQVIPCQTGIPCVQGRLCCQYEYEDTYQQFAKGHMELCGIFSSLSAHCKGKVWQEVALGLLEIGQTYLRKQQCRVRVSAFAVIAWDVPMLPCRYLAVSSASCHVVYRKRF